MSSVRHPTEKKRLSLARDHYSKAEYDKARKGWRRKEKSIERACRHQVKAKLGSLDDPDAPVVVFKKKVKKWPVAMLGERVKHKLSERKQRVGSRIQRQAVRRAR
jgi:hypothetical protein